MGADVSTIQYERYEFRGEPETRRADLVTFVYDIPYFGACGIFPPHHIINQIFGSGGSGGGMSPGATWGPFEITEEDYRDLVREIRQVAPESLGENARYTRVKFEFDESFDHIRDWESWLFAVCDKHRDSYLEKQGPP
jgi:hypothetical protein